MKKILFDLESTQPAGGAKRHGGGKYGEIVLTRIIERELPVICCYNSQLWLNPEIKSLLENNNIPLIDHNLKSYDEIVELNGISLFFIPVPINLKYEICKTNVQVLGVFHGLRSLESPIDYHQLLYKPLSNAFKYFAKKILTKIFIRRSKKYYNKIFVSNNFKFLTVSHHSAASFKTFFPEFMNKDIPVFYSPSTSTINTTDRQYNDKYFLLVSANRHLKNNLRAIQAFDNLFSKGYAGKYRVKVVGTDTPQKSFRYRIKNKDKFDFIGYVDELKLDQLYHDAFCFVYPSLNEGFGYPPLEAMHYGVPVLSSPFASIAEICGGSVMYFNPLSIDEITNRIIQIMDESTHLKYSMLSKERYEVITNIQNEDLDKLVDYIYTI